LNQHNDLTEEREAEQNVQGITSSLTDLLLARMRLIPETVDSKSPSALTLLANFVSLSEEDQMTVLRVCASGMLQLSEENLRTLLNKCISLPSCRAKLRLGCAVNALFKRLPQPVHMETLEVITLLLLSDDYCNTLIGANIARTVRMKEGIERLMKERNNQDGPDSTSERAMACFKRLVMSAAYWYL